jgi:hypothetical protein
MNLPRVGDDLEGAAVAYALITAIPTMQVSRRSFNRDLLLASLGWGVGPARRTPSRPGRAPIYRLIRRPALAEIVGAGRAWTVPMISLLSMPCR